ncbi:MAG: nitroreductase family protein [Bacteroidales bacterium]
MDQESPLSWIISRRSIRKYSDRVIPDEDIRKILRSAMYAPSAVNCQPWHFIVVTDKERFETIMDFHPNASFLKGASHAILVCGDEEMQHDQGYYIADCAASTQNLLLAAHAMGIGSCWIGVYPRVKRVEMFRELFGLPEHIQPFALVSLGYPTGTKETPERFSQEKIHYNSWGNQ